MTPQHAIDDINVTGHAKGRLADLGVSIGRVYGRILHGHGFRYRDIEDRSYNFYMPDLPEDTDAGLTVAYALEYHGLDQIAIVRTAFTVDDAAARFNRDRWEKLD